MVKFTGQLCFLESKFEFYNGKLIKSCQLKCQTVGTNGYGGGLGPVYPSVWRPKNNGTFVLVGYNNIQITQHDIIEVRQENFVLAIWSLICLFGMKIPIRRTVCIKVVLWDLPFKNLTQVV